MRKIREIFLAIEIERMLSKEEILELYVNKIFLGYRSYGFGAAAQTYFGNNLEDLTLSELATLAGMPKAPSTMNPIYSLNRATGRRNIVLRRMLEEGYISQQEFDDARAEEIKSKYHGAEIELSAPYVAEIARAWMLERYGEDAYTSGMRVYTTVDSKLQDAANKAAINNLYDYDERHGYRTPRLSAWEAGETPLESDEINRFLRPHPIYGKLRPAVVTGIEGQSATVHIKGRGENKIVWDQMKWARPFINDDRQGAAPKKAADIMKLGQLVWVRAIDDTPEVEVAEVTENEESITETNTVWRLSQVPEANTAFVAMNPENGQVLSLVGGLTSFIISSTVLRNLFVRSVQVSNHSSTQQPLMKV